MNTMTFEKLQYNELKDIVKSYCVSGLGKELLNKLEPSTSIKVVRNRLNETTEARAILDAEGHVPFFGISNIASTIQKLEKGMILDPEELVSVSDFLRGCRKIKKFMLDKEFFAPVLASYANSMTEYKSIEEEINFSIKGNSIDAAASKELKRIRNNIDSVDGKIKERLTKFLNSSANKKFIQEFFISKKDDRYTIPIKSSYKNQVAGSIIEASAKGSTVFIEPHTVTKLNAELAGLKAEEAVEEYQILATLSGMVLENIYSIKINMELISQYDMVFAKAKFSKSIDGIEPKLNDHGYIHLVNCKHPLLTGQVVPLNFKIGQEYRSLIITGPNAGGKTIVLKTIGLLTLATMSGLHIAGDKGTEIAIFENVFVDIGDNQSIENALSTFSSHMKNLSEIMRMSNNNTLLLFDEIGSGTEPNEGAALAISILEELYLTGCITVASTHYGEIKRFSEMHDDFMNAAMQFNSETLEPLYKLVIGKSGESNALWIANKMSVKEHVLKRAKEYMGNKEYALEKVNESKIRKPKFVQEKREFHYEYKIGDRVNLLDYDDFGIIYKEKDNFYNVVVYYNGEFVEVNVKRITLEVAAKELYPEGYDLNTLFVDYKERKMQHDIERGSKKALRKIQKEIRKNRG
ncbi:TPA: endonuclease MutS2 [Bacillus thuringiensis]|uniref:Mannonate oxidoreductase n=4 Tax=Bacillus cereus group TaxID=86661 RepID=A0A9X7H964_BACCE|nr:MULTISPECIES: mannonate oxidoreductase [Bacillus]WIL45656.1 endonuclease MutS2 [Bacillus bombysepticus]AGE79305.1 DNA mismatch repair protein [Bacillus thuringiensis serovar kurstaki str. HD73]AHZ52299.1 DNA mismatch repair protein mutS [Bacillus thuringiensis serovar kurstaki str. YBT-1520]AIE34724.1 DNA mismatch repair protein mutS [Bacillus thuringiensis serovar kurstaki str. HD-1]AIM30925.1 DNA mismatch repair protein [Bacillus thuringiensis serovar kurstaki str. YBT-1520]